MAEVAVELQPLSASGLPTPVPAPPPNPKTLPRFHHSAITRCMCRQCKRAFESVWACIVIARAKLQVIYTATRRKYTLSTWLAIGITIIIGSLGSRYAYVQVVLSNESLRLAQWTARKDFWEICSVQKDSNNPFSADCEQAPQMHHLPAPPDMPWGVEDSTSEGFYSAYSWNDLGDSRLTANTIQSFLFFVLVTVLYLQIRQALSTLRRKVPMANDQANNRPRESGQAEDTSNTVAISPMSLGSGRPPAQTVRRRRRKEHSGHLQHLKDSRRR